MNDNEKMEQPTNEELHAAWTNAINLEGSGAVFSAAIQELGELRYKRSTWFGSEEKEQYAYKQAKSEYEAYADYFYECWKDKQMEGE